MNPGRRRGAAVWRSAASKTDEADFKAAAQTESLLPETSSASSPSREALCVDTSTTTTTTTTRRAGKGKDPGPHSENQGVTQSTSRSLSTENEVEDLLVITVDNGQTGMRQRRKGGLKRKREKTGDCTEMGSQQDGVQGEDEMQPEVEIDSELDRELENKSRQHNLTSANVRSIIHEVITNEHVVAMMKAAINEKEPVPLFEPKMTRSKLKEVVEKGVVIPAWNISPIKKPSKEKAPQFVDIPLEEEDSSDEEYCPDEEEEDETAEDTLLESDLESTASSPRGTRISLSRSYSECDGENNSRQSVHRARHLRVEVVPMGPPPPPQSPEPPVSTRECSFMEKLYAVDEELAIGSECMDSYQSLSSNGEESLMAFRTRSKRPLRDVPLGRLEAELRAPDITPDMYEHGSATEDREWTRWLQGLMSSDMENEEEADDEDDPEYNFLADIDEPDVEDYRNDKAVRITKKEVNDLMEELFDAFQDELGGLDEEGHEEEEEKEEDDIPQPDPPSILETIEYEDPLADVLKQRYRTVKEHLAALRSRKTLLESKGVPVPPPRPKRPTSPTANLFLSPDQKLHLQQHIQQHVQLLTQVNMLCRSVEALQTEVCTTRQFLSELHFFADQGELARRVADPAFVSVFRTCNLQPALSLLEEVDESAKIDPAQAPVFPGSQFPAHLAWLMATRPVFLYPELLPEVNLRTFNRKGPFTSAENCLLVLGHQHLMGTVNPLKLTCRYLLAARNIACLRTQVRTAFHKQSCNIIKKYFLEGKRPRVPLACQRISPNDQRPPVEREKNHLPLWLSTNLKLIHDEVRKYNQPPVDPEGNSTPEPTLPPASLSSKSEPASSSYSFPAGTRYPPCLPETLALTLKPQPGPQPRPHPPRKKAPPRPSVQTNPQYDNHSIYSQLFKERGSSYGHLPPILPKVDRTSIQICPVQPHPTAQRLQRKARSKTLKTKPSRTEAGTAKSKGKSKTSVSNVTTPNLSQGSFVLTLPVAANQNRPFLGNIAVNELNEEHVTQAPADPNQANVIATLPSAPMATAFGCPSLFSNIVAPSALSQPSGTLLKISTGPSTPSLKPLSQNTLHQFLVLPPNCVVANNDGHQNANLNPQPNSDHNLKDFAAEKTMSMEQLSQTSCKDSFLQFSWAVQEDEAPNSGYPGYREVSSVKEIQFSQGIHEEMEVDEFTANNQEPEEYEGVNFRKPFLTLSESSGSPAPSLAEESDAEEVMVDAQVESEREKQGRKEEGQNQISTLKDELEKLPSLNTIQLSDVDKLDGHASGCTEQPAEEILESALLSEDYSDDDPQKDLKDVAFAHAYLEKACEVLKAVPGKVEEFLGVLYEFEREPEGKTSVELFMRLKPVLSDWPELLKDFAAFLHPEQAKECGLLAEQQAFERSRSFLRQLELTFGENSPHYKKVVRTLQNGPMKSLSGSEEMKKQIAILFRNHEPLLEEYLVFFKQLHSTLPSRSEEEEEVHEEEDDADVDNTDSVQSMEGSLQSQTATSLFVEDRETCRSQTHERELCITTQEEECCSTGKEPECKVAGERDTQSHPSALPSPVCAKNSSCMPSGEKVVLWTREADRVILTTCQQKGAKESTFSSIAAQLGNKTASEVGARFQDLIKLFHTSTKQHHTTQLDTEARSTAEEEEEPD